MSIAPPASRDPWPARAFVAVYATIHTLAAFLPEWWSPERFDGDHSQHVWWTARFADPDLFPGDFIADFFSLPIFAPLGWQTVMRLGVQVADPQRVAETLPFLLGPLCFWLAWRAGRSLGGGSVGAVAAALCVPLLLGGLQGGMPRGFSAPVLLLAVVGLLERRLVWLGVAGLGAALFYPPAAINVGLTAAVVLGSDLWRERRLPRGWPALAAFAALAVAVVLWAYATPRPDDVGPKLTGAEARTMAEFGADGRSRLFDPSPLRERFGEGRGGYGMPLAVTAALAVGVAGSAALLPRLLPATAWALVATAMLAHAAAWATLFALHLPSKYTRHALPVFAILWLAALAGRLLGRARPGARALLAAGAAFLLVDGAVALRGVVAELTEPTYGSRTKMYRAVARLPKDALVAAHPEDANAIPLVSRRSVLASKEVALPYYRGYYERVAERLEASLRGHYALDWETLDGLWERYGVDVFVAHEHRFTPEARGFSEPFASRLGDVLRHPRKDYVLAEPPRDRVLWKNDAFRIVRLGPPRPGYPAREESAPSESAPAAAGTR